MNKNEKTGKNKGLWTEDYSCPCCDMFWPDWVEQQLKLNRDDANALYRDLRDVMVLKRCPFCRRRFRPHPQTVKIQKACSQAACRRERHRLACRVWNKEHPEYDRSRRAKIRAWARAYPNYWRRYRARRSAQ